MPDTTFSDALAQAHKELAETIKQRDKLNLEILRLQQLVKALSYQAHKSEQNPAPDVLSDSIGFTEAILTVLRTTNDGMTARAIRDRLLELGFELGHYSNPLGFVHSAIGRLEAQGKIRQSAPGEYTFNTGLWRALHAHASDRAELAPVEVSEPSKPDLTLRQQQLVSLVAKGLTNKEIASQLNLSEFTVRNHIHRILKQVNTATGCEEEDTRKRAVTLFGQLWPSAGTAKN